MKNIKQKIVSSAVKFFNSNDYLKTNVIGLYLIGNQYVKENRELNDIDFVAVVKDSISPVFFIEQISQFLYNETIENKVLINIFPIHETNMNRAYSMFVKNVLEYGTKVK